jgi:hypothetical protein
MPPNDDRRTFAGVLVDDVQQLQRATIDGRVELEVERPKDVRSDRTHRTNCDADTAVRLLPLAIRHFQSFLTPEAMHSLVVDLPAVATELLRGAPPAPPRSPSREPAQPRAELGFVVAADGWAESLRRAMLTDDLARSSLGDPEPIAQRGDSVASTVRG